MTLLNQNDRTDHTGDNSTVTWAYDFRIDADDEIIVYLDGVVQTLTTDYSVTGTGAAGGGTIIFVTAPGTGVAIAFLRDVDLTQEVDYSAYGDFPEDQHELALDRLAMQVQQINEKINRALVGNPGDPTEYELPPYTAGEFWRWDSVLQEIVTADISSIGAASIGLNIGDLFKLINVGGSAGLPAVDGSNLLNTSKSPIGSGLIWFTDTPPADHFELDGSVLEMVLYPELYAVLGSTAGLGSGTAFTVDAGIDVFTSAGHGLADDDILEVTNSGGALPAGMTVSTPYYIINSSSNTFQLSLTSGGAAINVADAGTGTHTWHNEYKLPATSGYFLRVWDNGAGIDPDAASRTDRGDGVTGDNILTKQPSANKEHTHTFTRGSTVNATSLFAASSLSNDGTTNVSTEGEDEARSINIYIMLCIRYQEG